MTALAFSIVVIMAGISKRVAFAVTLLSKTPQTGVSNFYLTKKLVNLIIPCF